MAIIPNCNPLPGHPPLLPVAPPSCTVNDLFVLLVNIYNFLLGMLAILAVLFIVWYGVRMIIHYVSETPEQDLKDAKLGLTRAIYGIVLIAVAWLLVNTLLTVLGVSRTGALGQLLIQYGLLNP